MKRQKQRPTVGIEVKMEKKCRWWTEREWKAAQAQKER
jgi:hypothetical protein